MEWNRFFVRLILQVSEVQMRSSLRRWQRENNHLFPLYLRHEEAKGLPLLSQFLSDAAQPRLLQIPALSLLQSRPGATAWPLGCDESLGQISAQLEMWSGWSSGGDVPGFETIPDGSSSWERDILRLQVGGQFFLTCIKYKKCNNWKINFHSRHKIKNRNVLQ